LDYGLLNIGSIILGLVAWILPIINLAKGNKAECKSWVISSITSVIACATSICMQYFYQNHFVQTKNWSMLLSTFGIAATASALLLFVTIVLNVITMAVYFKRMKNGIVEIIKGTDGPTAIYYASRKK
jgi:cytochrome c oxidase subunit 4